MIDEHNFMGDDAATRPGGAATGADNAQARVPTEVERVIETPADFDRLTMTVEEARKEFELAGLNVPHERTIQRKCDRGRLRAVKVDPLTGQPTDREPSQWMIDPAGVASIISDVKKSLPVQGPSPSDKQTTSPDNAATRPGGAQARRDDVGGHVGGADEDEIQRLKAQIHSLEIDKGIRDALLKKADEREIELIRRLDVIVDKSVDQAREIGRLEEHIKLALPQPEHDGGAGGNPQAEHESFSV